MNCRHACAFTGAAVLTCVVAFAQSTQQAPAQPVDQEPPRTTSPLPVAAAAG